jgi:hypothetical protein
MLPIDQRVDAVGGFARLTEQRVSFRTHQRIERPHRADAERAARGRPSQVDHAVIGGDDRRVAAWPRFVDARERHFQVCADEPGARLPVRVHHAGQVRLPRRTRRLARLRA